MSDAILERIAKALETIAAQGGKVAGAVAGAAAGAAAGKAATTAAPAGKPAAAPPAGKPAAAPAGKPAAAPKPAAAATKAPGGKYSIEQVRDVIRKVATNTALGKQSATDILDQDGGGVTTVSTLKPEFFDAVYEACQVALSGEGAGEPAGEEEFDPTA